MIDHLPIAAHAFSTCGLASLSVDQRFLPRFVNWFDYFKSLLFMVQLTTFCLKHMNSFYLHSRRNYGFLLLVRDYTAGVQLESVYLHLLKLKQ